MTNKAAEELSKLQVPERFKKGFEEQAERQAEEERKRLTRGRKGTGIFLPGITGALEGTNDEERLQNMQNAIASARKSGVSMEAITRTTRMAEAEKFFKFQQENPLKALQAEERGEVMKKQKWTVDEWENLIMKIQKLQDEGGFQPAVKKVAFGLSDEERKILGRIQSAKTLATEQGKNPEFDLPPNIMTERQALFQKLKGRFGPTVDPMLGMVQLEQMAGGKQGAVESRTQQLRASLVKAQVKNEIELAKIRDQGVDALDEQLSVATSLKSLTESELLALKEKIALRDKDRNINAKIGDILIKNVDTIDKLTVSQKQEAALLVSVLDLDMKALATDKKREAVLKKIGTVIGMTPDQMKLFLENADKAVLSLKAQGEADKDNIKKKTKLNQKQAEFNRLLQQGVKLSNLQAGRTLFETTRGDAQERIRLQSRIDDINRNPTLTDKQKATQAEQFIIQLEKLDIKEADAKALKDFREALNQLALDIPTLKKAVEGAQGKVTPAAIAEGGLGPTIANARAGLDEAVRKGQLRGKGGTFLPGSLQGDFSERGKQGIMFGTFKLEQDKNAQALKDNTARIKAGTAARGRENEFLGRFDRLSDHLRNFANTLEEVDEKLKFDFLFARSGTDMISQIRNRREKQAMGAVRGDAAGTAGVTKDFALEEFDQQIRLAPTRAERRNLQRQRPFLEDAFEVQKRIAELSKDEVKNADELKVAQEELLQIEEKRLQANETIAAKLENAFVFSQRDIRNQLGDNLVSAAKNFSDRMADGLVNAIAKGEDLGETLKMAARDFLLDMAKANMKAAFQNISSGIFGGGKASGGMITGGSGKRDDVPTMLMGGEFVVNKRAVQKYGPNFLNALNMGAIQGMARGGFFTPGTYGQGAITGKSDLLSFATQPYTTGQFDKISGGRGFASVDLEPQSGRLTMWGRKNSPRFQREQASKRDAFGLYTQQVGRETRMKEQEEENKKSLSGAFKAALITGALSWAMGGSGLGSLFSKNQNATAPPAASSSTMAQRTAAQMQGWDDFIGMAAGGAVPYAAGVDSVPSMLSGGEFVMNAAATQRIGRGTLNALNGGAGGRGEEEIVGKLDELIEVSEGAERGESVINITVNSDGTETEEGGTKAADTQKTLAVRIRDVVKQVIDEEKRLGGSLRQAKG